MVPNQHVTQETAAGRSPDIASLMLIFPVVVNRLVFILSSLHSHSSAKRLNVTHFLCFHHLPLSLTERANQSGRYLIELLHLTVRH